MFVLVMSHSKKTFRLNSIRCGHLIGFSIQVNTEYHVWSGNWVIHKILFYEFRYVLTLFLGHIFKKARPILIEVDKLRQNFITFQEDVSVIK